jgi:predicted SAM-dependent methyltransferase
MAMFESVTKWISDMNTKFGIEPQRVLDIGSKDRNLHEGARACFPDSVYVGIDIAPGPNVDAVVDAYKLDKYFDPESQDAVLCLHLYEHLAKPWLVMEQVYKVLAPRGYMFLSVPTLGFPKHNYPGDYWRPTYQAVTEVFMDGYEILSIMDDHSKFSKHPFVNCLGRKQHE